MGFCETSARSGQLAWNGEPGGQSGGLGLRGNGHTERQRSQFRQRLARARTREGAPVGGGSKQRATEEKPSQGEWKLEDRETESPD